MLSLSFFVNDVFTRAPILIWLFVIFSVIIILSFNRGFTLFLGNIFKMPVNEKYFRTYFLLLNLLVTVTAATWFIDSNIYPLPDPVISYILFVLVITIIFGAELGILTGIFSFLLVDYFLFDPIFQIYLSKNPASIVSTIIGLNLAFLIGIKVHQNIKKLIKETKDLKTLIEARDQFAASTVHDFKNPITTIKLHTQLIENKKAGKNGDSLLAKSTETIVKEADKLLTMTNQLLDYSKIKNGKFVIKKADLDLYELCKNRIEILRESYPHRKIIFSSNKKKIKIRADKVAIDRVVTNLMVNAIKYSPEDKPVALKLDTSKKCQMRISDKGDGIPKENQELLFEPFYQVNKASQGLGLGLYIVKSLVELHQGSITFESIKSKGTTFFVDLPII